MNSYHGKSVYQLSLLEDPQKQVIGSNIVYKFLLDPDGYAEAVCCCLQTCSVYILILLMSCICVQSFVILGVGSN